MVQLDSGGGGDDTEQAATERRRAQEVEGEQQAQDALRQLDDSNLESTPTTDPTTTATEPVRQTGTVDSGPQLDGGQQAAEEQETTQQTQEPPETVQDGPTPTTGTPGQTGVVEPEAPAPDRPPADMPQEPDITTEDVSQAQRSRAASQFEEQIQEQTGEEFDVTAEDVVVRGGQFTLGGSARAALSRQQAEAAGVDLSARAERAEAQASLAPEGEAAVESGGLDISTEVIQEFEETQFREVQGPGVQGLNVEGVEAVGEQRGEIEQQLEQQIEEATGRDVELEPGDFEVTTEDGERRAQLTQQGIDKVQTQPLTEAVEQQDIRPKKIVIEPGPFEGAFPGAGVIGAGVRLEELGPVAKDIGVSRDFGNIDLQVAQFGDRPVTPGPGVAERPTIGTKDFETVLAEISEDIDAAVQVQPPAVEAASARPGRAGAALRSEQQFFTGTGQEAAAGFGEATLEGIPRFAVGAAQLGKDVADFSVEVGETEIQELDTLFTGAGQTAINIGAVGTAGAIEAPALTGARAAGTLLASGGIFAGAAAIGPRTSLAARAAIQPGEEALGFGGFAATRRLAGTTTAQRLFPNREPLIFSEEAAIRGIRAASRRINARVGDIDVPRAEGRAVESLFGELQTEVGIQERRFSRPFREPREIIEGSAVGRINVQPRFAGETGPVDVFDAEAGLQSEVDTEPSDIGDVEPGDVEAGGVRSGGGGFDLELEQETGTGQAEALRMRIKDFESELDMPSEAEFEQARIDPAIEVRSRVETALDMESIGEVDMEPIGEVGFMPGEVTGAAERLTPGEVLDPQFDLDLDQEFAPPALETVFEPGEIEVNVPIQTQRVEARQELELELESELERPFEVESESRDRRRIERRPVIDPSLETATRVIEFDIPTPEDVAKRLERGGGVDVNLENVDVEVGDIDVDFDLD